MNFSKFGRVGMAGSILFSGVVILGLGFTGVTMASGVVGNGSRDTPQQLFRSIGKPSPSFTPNRVGQRSDSRIVRASHGETALHATPDTPPVAPANDGQIVQVVPGATQIPSLPFGATVMDISSYFQAVTGSTLLSVYTGVEPSNPSVGVIAIWNDDPNTASVANFPFVETMAGAGNLTLTSVSQDSATVTDASGASHTVSLSTGAIS
jgi:hypothetical protein